MIISRMTNAGCKIVMVILFYIVGTRCQLTTVVQTDKGPIRGEILKTVETNLLYASFKGIPYAKPPLGYLRFKPPVAAESWSDVLNATKEGSMCTQYNTTSSSVVGSDDCLYINVFTPHTDFTTRLSKSVMVWIYGGTYETGNSNASYYGPDFLLNEDVIVVSFNYRLGPLGFLNLNHVNATGNSGLKDQNLALRWVKRNIVNFGGDPARVTIMGQSAGSVSVDLHIVSDMSDGLFEQTITMSGAPLCLYWGFQTDTAAEEQAFILGEKLGVYTSDKDVLIRALYNATSYDIINQAHGMPLIPFRPSLENPTIAPYEEKFLTECTIKKYKSGNYSRGPQILGFTSNEFVTFAKDASYLIDVAKEALKLIKDATFTIDISFLSFVAALTTNDIANFTEMITQDVIEDFTDLFFVTGVDSKQKLLGVHNEHPIYYYRFSYDSPYSTHKLQGNDLDGVGHNDDLAYLFYRPFLGIPLNDPGIKITRQRYVRLWTNFAKYGDPTSNGTSDPLLGVIWPDSRSHGEHLEINETLTIGLRPIDSQVKLFEDVGLGTSPILNDCSHKYITESLHTIADDISDMLH